MKLVNNTAVATTQAEPVTATYAIRGPINVDVCAGIPMGDAFNNLSTLLSAAKDALDAIAMGERASEDPTGIWCIVYNLELAWGQVQAMHKGYIQHRKQVVG